MSEAAFSVADSPDAPAVTDLAVEDDDDDEGEGKDDDKDDDNSRFEEFGELAIERSRTPSLYTLLDLSEDVVLIFFWKSV